MLKVVTYNIHKGFSPFNRRVVLNELREQLRALNPDIVFLQEVQGEHVRHPVQHADYPAMPQYEFLADAFWAHHVYGMNAVYEAGHHGNAILSRFPIVQSRNCDLSAHRFEQRGLLHGTIDFHGQPVHCLCAHFGLFARGRRQQLRRLIEYVQRAVPAQDRLVIAGDFNDWRDQLSRDLAAALQVREAHSAGCGRPARSFPAALPLLKLDRIYVRGFEVLHCQAQRQRRLSDHAPLYAQLRRQ
ncbi:MAG: endonuclease/exonuclease/phosphatase family protein [Sideroxydans sp.]